MNSRPMPREQQEDEIDFFELTVALWNRKWLIVGITTFVIALASVYLVVTPKVYEARVLISETQPVNMTQLNVGKEQLGSYAQSVTAESVYNLFQKKLHSRSLALAYFKEHVEPVYRESGATSSTVNLLDTTFLKSLNISKPSKGNIYQVVTFQYTDPVLAAEWLNGYLRFVERKTKEDLIRAALDNKAQALREYEQEISSLIAIYGRKLGDKIIRLNEAATIAKKLNIRKPLVSDITVKVSSREFDESLLYMRGYEVLLVEVDTLKSRTSIESFIPEIRPIQEVINYLESVSYDVNTLGVITVDAWADEPERSIKPKKFLVLLVSALLGGMIGVFFAFASWVMKRKTLG